MYGIQIFKMKIIFILQAVTGIDHNLKHMKLDSSWYWIISW